MWNAPELAELSEEEKHLLTQIDSVGHKSMVQIKASLEDELNNLTSSEHDFPFLPPLSYSPSDRLREVPAKTSCCQTLPMYSTSANVIMVKRTISKLDEYLEALVAKKFLQKCEAHGESVFENIYLKQKLALLPTMPSKPKI